MATTPRSTVSQTTSYLDPDVSAGNTYTYRLRSIDYGGESNYSNEALVTTPLTGDPLPINGIRLWLKAVGIINPLALWQDQSGNANDAVQLDATRRPSITVNSINGLPTARFSGSQWLNLPNLMNGATAGEIFLVLKVDQYMLPPAYGLMTFGGDGKLLPLYRWDDLRKFWQHDSLRGWKPRQPLTHIMFSTFPRRAEIGRPESTVFCYIRVQATRSISRPVHFLVTTTYMDILVAIR